MHTASTLCYVRTMAGEVVKVNEGESLPDETTETDVTRLLAAGSIAKAKSPELSRRRSAQSES